MIKIKVDERGDGKKLVSYLQNQFRKLPQSAIYKALRNKDIKQNGKRVKENVSLRIGDELEIYISDAVLYGKLSTFATQQNQIAYQDENILIYKKPSGIEVQGTNGEIGLQEALQKDLGISYLEACHRLDRNTQGLVIFAKTRESEENMLSMIKERKVKKLYKALVYGIPTQKEATLRAYLWKDKKASHVVIREQKKVGYQEIITKYRVLEENKKENTALLEVELVTGRTHQIRAHLAYMGYPIIGDGKYGNNQVNKKFAKDTQQLISYQLLFEEGYGNLQYLKGKVVKW